MWHVREELRALNCRVIKMPFSYIYSNHLRLIGNYKRAGIPDSTRPLMRRPTKGSRRTAGLSLIGFHESFKNAMVRGVGDYERNSS